MDNTPSLNDVLNPNGPVTNALKKFQISNDAKDKKSQEFGAKIIIQCEQILNSSYFRERNQRFEANEAIAEGRMDTNMFKDLLNIDGKTNYVNLDWSPIKTPNTIVSRMVQRWMTKREKVVVEAVDPISTKQKKQKVDEAEFLLYNKELLEQLQGESGVQMIPQDEFIPDDKDDLDLWAREELRTPEEILYEKGCNNVLEEYGFASGGMNARKIRWDSAAIGLIAAETYADRNGKIHIDIHSGKNSFYSYSDRDDLSDSSIKGVVVAMKMSDIKDQFPSLTVKELFEIAKDAKEWNSNNHLTYNEGQYYRHEYLPFDDWNVNIVRFTLESLDVDKSLIKTARDGSMYVDKPKKPIGEVYEGNEYVEKKIWNIYRGIYVRSSKKILYWGLEKNMIRPQSYSDMCKAYSPFTFYMYQNNRMRNLAIPEKIESPVKGMQLTLLKIQQFIAKMRPSGMKYDIDGMQNMDLGNGICTPLELQRITDQTGNVYFRSRDAEGNRLESPVTENPNAAGAAQLQELIGIYNFHFEVLRNEIGSNEQAEGQTAKPRVGVANVQTSLEISFNASDHINDACIALTADISKRVACLLHDSVEFGSKEYREILKETDVKERAFDTRIEVLPTTEALTEFDASMNLYIQAMPDLLLYMNPEKIKRVARENLKLGEAYLRQSQRRALQGQQKMKQIDSKMNADNQIASSKAAEEEKRQTLKEELEVKSGVELTISAEKQKEALIGMFSAILSKGLEVPAAWKTLEQQLISNISMPLTATNSQMANDLQQQMQPQPQQEGQVQPEIEEQQVVEEQPMM